MSKGEVKIDHLLLFIPDAHDFYELRRVHTPPVLLVPDQIIAVIVADTVYLTHRHLVETFAVGRAKLAYKDTFTVKVWGTVLTGIELLVPRPYAFSAFFLRELYGCSCLACCNPQDRVRRFVKEIADYLGSELQPFIDPAVD